jgi:hypothetical protein
MVHRKKNKQMVDISNSGQHNTLLPAKKLIEHADKSDSEKMYSFVFIHNKTDIE